MCRESRAGDSRHSPVGLESAKNKKCRDKFIIGVCDNILIVVLTMCDLTLSSILQKPDKTPTESARIHDVIK